MHTEAQHGRPLYSVAEIRESYDAQARESFNAKFSNPFFRLYGAAVGRKLAQFKPLTMLDAGCGDGVTLYWALQEAKVPVTFGIDCSPARIAIAKDILEPEVTLRVGDFFQTDFGDDTFDLVYTSHALEPNGGREAEGIRELYRVARKWLVLFEPDWYQASLEGRARMRRLNYVTRIPETIEELGLELAEWSQFRPSGNPLNPTGCWVIRKAGHA